MKTERIGQMPMDTVFSCMMSGQKTPLGYAHSIMIAIMCCVSAMFTKNGCTEIVIARKRRKQTQIL